MTRNRVMVFLILTFAVILLVKQQNVPTIISSHPKVPQDNSHQLTLSQKPRDVIDQNKHQLKQIPAGARFVNKPSPEWKNLLELSLKTQGGENLKEIKIEREKSLIWMKDNQALMVESVLVSLTNQQDTHSSFRALVDSQTGKILESWDRTLFDPASTKDGFRFKLDPRYSNGN